MRKFEGTKKCAYCGRELTQDDIKDYYEDSTYCQWLIAHDELNEQEMCPYCGYHNDLIEEDSMELYYSVIT